MATKSTRLLLLSSLLFISSFLLAQNRLGQGSSVNNHSSAILSTGKAVMWGVNMNGQLGNGGSENVNIPKDVYSYGELAGKIITNISSGWLHTLALTSDGTVYAWGSNFSGEAGLSEYINYLLPAAVSLPKKAKAISAGYNHSVALMEDGTVYTWGKNNVGQIGNGNTSPITAPYQVAALQILLL